MIEQMSTKVMSLEDREIDKSPLELIYLKILPVVLQQIFLISMQSFINIIYVFKRLYRCYFKILLSKSMLSAKQQINL